MRRRSAVAFALTAPFTTLGLAQSTHLVGPGFHPEIYNAMAIANPGDIVHVLPGTYAAFALSPGVTVRAATPGTVFVTGALPSWFQVPPGQTGHVVGLNLNSVIATGRLTLDDCHIGPQLQIGNGAVVIIQDCTIAGAAGYPTFSVLQSEVTITNSTIVGGLFIPGWAAPAIQLTNARLRGSHLQVQCNPANAVTPAIRGDAASWLWLSDSTVDADPLACAIMGPNGHHSRCVLSPNCTTLPNGFGLGANRLQPIQNGTTFTVEFHAAPGMAVGVLAAPDFAPSVHPALAQSLLLPPGAAFSGGIFIANGLGVASAAWPIPAGSMFVNQTLWLQGFTGFTFPLQASAAIGGVVR